MLEKTEVSNYDNQLNVIIIYLMKEFFDLRGHQTLKFLSPIP